MKNTKGFTLLEMVVVIVILAILAVVVFPRYLSLKGDANASVVKSLAGSFRYVVDNVKVKAILQGVDNERDVIVFVEDIPINTYFGVPQEIWDDRLGELLVGDISYVGNGYFNLGSSGVGSYRCPYELCVIDQTPGSWVSSDIRGWGMFLFPETYSLNDKCYAYYAFLVEGAEVTSLQTESVTEGC